MSAEPVADVGAPLDLRAHDPALAAHDRSELSRMLAEQFEILAAAEGGVERMRQLILSLAFKGRLSGYVARTPSELPIGWTKARLGQVATQITKGTTPTSVGFGFERTGIRFVKVENVEHGHIQLATITDFISEATHHALSRSQLAAGDVLFSIAGTIGETCVVAGTDVPANTNQALAIIRGTSGTFDPAFLRRQLDSFVARAIKARARGGAMPNVSLGDLRELEVVVAPFEEQKRVVARIDQLMALCDELEARQTKKRETSTRLTKSALEALTTAEGPEQFDLAWTRVVDNFDVIIDRADAVRVLKQSLIDLAVSGRLSKCSAWPSRMLAEVVVETRYGTSRKCGRDSSLTPVLRIPNVVAGRVNTDDLKYTTFPDDELHDLRLRRGDILVVRSNGSRDLVGRCCIVDASVEGFAFAGYLIRLRLGSEVLPEWCCVAMQSSDVRRSIEGPARTTSGVHNVNTKELHALSIPVPSLSAQSDALSALTPLMVQVDALTLRLVDAEERATSLAAAVVHDLVY